MPKRWLALIRSSNGPLQWSTYASPSFSMLTQWGRVTHICVSKLSILGSDNGLSPTTNAEMLLSWPLGTNFSEILIDINTFSFKKMYLKMSSGKLRPFVSASMCFNGNWCFGHCWLLRYPEVTNTCFYIKIMVILVKYIILFDCLCCHAKEVWSVSLSLLIGSIVTSEWLEAKLLYTGLFCCECTIF